MRTQAGFTLMETLIYLALFAIVIGGGMVAVFEIIQSTDATNNKIIMQEEANFFLRKIDWSLTGATAVSVPASTSLQTTKNISGTPTQINFSLSGSNLNYQQGSGSAAVLNSSSIAVSNLSFVKTSTAGEPDAITASFTLTSVQNGRAASDNFSTTKYLRQ